MPIYEYRCDSCVEELEKLQRMSDDKLVDCPACGEPALKRLVSAAAFRLKGSGWYETDFKKDNKRNLHDSGTGSASKDSGAEKSTGSDKKTSTESTAKAGKSNAA